MGWTSSTVSVDTKAPHISRREAPDTRAPGESGHEGSGAGLHLTSPQAPHPLLCPVVGAISVSAFQERQPGAARSMPGPEAHASRPPLPRLVGHMNSSVRSGTPGQRHSPPPPAEAGSPAQVQLGQPLGTPQPLCAVPASVLSTPPRPQAATMPSARPGRPTHGHGHGQAGKHPPWLLSPPACLRGLRGPGRTLEGARGQGVSGGLPESEGSRARWDTGLAGRGSCSQAFRTRPGAFGPRRASGLG